MKKNFKWWRLLVQIAAGALVIAGGVDLLELTMPVMLVAMVLGGAFFCGWLCPFGTLQDLISRLTYKIKKRQMPKPIQRVLGWLRYVLFILSSLLTLDILFAIMNYDAKANFMSLIEGRTLALGAYIVLGLYLVAAVFFERPFCNYMCPEGAKYGLLSTLRPFRIVRNPEKCVQCDQCNKACPMQIDVAGKMNVTSPQCIDCFSCIAACPKKDALGYKFIRLTWKSGLLYLVAIIAATGLGLTAMAYSYNQSQAEAIESYENQIINSVSEDAAENSNTGLLSDSAETQTDPEGAVGQTNSASDATDLSDGTSAANTTVETAQANTSSGTGSASTSKTGTAAVKSSTGTTSTSGTASTSGTSSTASASSASGSTSTNNTATTPKATTTVTSPAATSTAGGQSSSSSTTAASQGAGYKDGTYTGQGEGFRGTMTIIVTISGGNITNIEMGSTTDDRKWLNRAWNAIPDLIIQSQSANVDTVSGATYSSIGIIEAVKDALSQAK